MEAFDLGAVREQLEHTADVVIAELRKKWAEYNSGPGVLDSLRAFAAAVDWTEPWIGALLAAHAVLLLLALACRRRQGAQAAIFVSCMAVVYNAERLNTLAAQHWRRFARQPYFDAQGVFTSAMLSAPLLLVMFAILISYLLQTVALLVEMKRKELQFKARQRRRTEAAAAGGSEPAADEPKKDK